MIKYHRTLQLMSQQRLAERAGLSLAQVSRIESGRIETPRFPTIEKLAKALGLEADELIELLLEEPPR